MSSDSVSLGASSSLASVLSAEVLGAAEVAAAAAVLSVISVNSGMFAIEISIPADDGEENANNPINPCGTEAFIPFLSRATFFVASAGKNCCTMSA